MDNSDWLFLNEEELNDLQSAIQLNPSSTVRGTNAREQDEPGGSGNNVEQPRGSQSSRRSAAAPRRSESAETDGTSATGGRYAQILSGERVLVDRRGAMGDEQGRIGRSRRGAANRNGRTAAPNGEGPAGADRFVINSTQWEHRSSRATASARNTRSRRGTSQLLSPSQNPRRSPAEPASRSDVGTLETEEIDGDTEGDDEARWELPPSRGVGRGTRSSTGTRSRSTRATSRLVEEFLSDDDSDSTNPLGVEPAFLNELDAVAAEMDAIFSDEATISDDDELTFDEEDDDFLPAINVSGLQGLRVIVEELSNQEMARRGGANPIDISSDEDTEEQRREWRRRGVDTANARRRAAANVAADAEEQAAQATAPSQGSRRNERIVSRQHDARGNSGNDNSNSNNNDKDDEDSQGPSKRCRLDPDVKNARLAEKEDDINRVATCSICLDDMNQGGDHRLVVLKCGHCFGESCVKRWLMSGKRSCPMCNRQASLKHMRVAFLDCHRLGESYELAEARKEIDDLRYREQKSCDQVRELNFRVEALVGQNALLNERVRQLEKGAHVNQPYLGQSSNELGGFPKTQSFTKLSGHCKYMAYSDKLGLIAVSAKPVTPFFEGFSVELCSLYDLKSRRAKLLHTHEIKDLDFHQNKLWLLTASLDNSARISSVDNLGLANVHTLQLHNKVWSACWSNASDTNFYLGLQNGDIVEYDVRTLRDPVQVLRGPSNNMIPIVSLKSITVNQERREVHGLACSQLRNAIRIYTEIGPNRYQAQNIPTAGNCFSLSYYAPNETLLVNSRTFSGSQGLKGVTNEVFCLDGRNGDTVVSAKCKFQSGGSSSVITKPAIVTSPTGELWACCLDDQAKTIQVFSCNDASLRLTLKSQDPLAKQFTQAERISLRGRSEYALAGLSDGGLTIFA